jgi:predicted amino acid-binding ACT domain protein
VLILSGGNIDMMMLSSVLQRGLVRSHRLVRLKVEIPDVPGALADLTRVLAELDSNIVEIEHQRAFAGSSVRSTVVELVLQMRGEEQADQVLAALCRTRLRGQRLHLTGPRRFSPGRARPTPPACRESAAPCRRRRRAG